MSVLGVPPGGQSARKRAGGGSPAPPSGCRTSDGSKDLSRQLLDDYILGEELGQGAYGVVYACTKRGGEGIHRAVKMVDKAETPVKEIKREAEILDQVEHPTIIKFHEVYYEKCFVCIVMDRYRGGDLIAGMQTHWETSGRIPSDKVKHIKRQCMIALQVLHEKNIVHRDIKGDNYLLDRIDIKDPNCRVVCTDFGTAVKCSEKDRISGHVGTKTYWAPEFYSNEYGPKVDVWALGVIIYGLLEGRFPFKDEETTRMRKPKLHPDLHPNCVDFVRLLLKKEDVRRASAKEATEHVWIRDEVAPPSVGAAPREERMTPRAEADVDWKKDAKERLNEAAPAMVNRERRYELVERLEKAAEGREKGGLTHFFNSSFEVMYRHEKKQVTFTWLPRDKIIAEGIWRPDVGLEVLGNMPEPTNETTASTSALFDRAAIEQTLSDSGIDISLFGKGEAKTLDAFLMEVKNGASRLMIDAAEYKKMVRVVDVVLLRVSYRTASGEKLFLVETGDRYADGRCRSNLYRLPGTKKEPHENVRKVAGRILRDMLGMTDCKILLDFRTKEIAEEEEDSPSFPGVRTVYRKQFVEGQVSVTDPVVLKRIKAEGPRGEYHFENSHKYARTLQWFTEAQCRSAENPVQLRAPRNNFAVSGLVMAPIAINEAALSSLLEAGGIDVARFGRDGAKSLKDLAVELANSEVSLARDDRGQIIRIVDVVALVLSREREGERVILCQVKETFENGQVRDSIKLPGSKKACHENQFVAAHRVLDRRLHVDENCVNLHSEKVTIIEEGKDSPSYPMMRTLYRRRIIQGDVLGPGDERIKE